MLVRPLFAYLSQLNSSSWDLHLADVAIALALALTAHLKALHPWTMPSSARDPDRQIEGYHRGRPKVHASWGSLATAVRICSRYLRETSCIHANSSPSLRVCCLHGDSSWSLPQVKRLDNSFAMSFP